MPVVIFLNSILWDYLLLFLLVGLGIYLTIVLKFPQKMMFPSLKKMVDDIKNKAPVPEGAMSPFQSLSTAVAAQVGTGNVVGVATAISAGGPGAAFWMLLSAFFGMASIFSEAILAQVYRQKQHGELVGGPAYYIKYGLKNNILAIIFALVVIIALGIVGIMVQSNSVVNSLNDAFQLDATWITVALIAAVGMILVGGMDRIAGFTEKIVPVMAFSYIFGSIAIIFLNIENFLPSLKMIIVGAFTPQAISGGALGIGVRETIRYGISRGLFSNEAGMGSTPHSHAVASVDHPVEQGMVAMIGVFISTFLICLSTVMVNLSSGAYDSTIPAEVMKEASVLLTQNSFAVNFGIWGARFVSFALTLFSLTTIVGWYFFAESNVKLLSNGNKKITSAFKIVSLSAIALAARLDPDTVWRLSDLFTGLMSLPNIIALFLLAKTTKSILDDYNEKKKLGKLSFDYPYMEKNKVR
ncbi:MAG: alanine:cation symporter family protein [Tissierellia bacterium]|nr:alanine:cation symporter family protein [Tissierellia bacterium]